jgi:uncharacterized protein YjbI with pentapeptide repeats
MIDNVRKADAIAQLKEHGDLQLHSSDYVGADLRGADLSGIRLSFANLSGARLDEVNLTGARLSNVILTEAQLRGARLQGAEFSFVEGTLADFSESDGGDSVWRHDNLLHAQFAKANLVNARFQNCTIEEASFAGANLSGGAIVDSACNRASFARGILANLETVGSSFREANFEEAESLIACREIVVEILRRHVTPEIEKLQLIGAVMLMRHWCYAEWKAYLTTPDMEKYYRYALEIFKLYPRSGTFQALQEGWDWRRGKGKGGSP